MAAILVVDDDLAIRRTMRALLEGEGYEVRLARNGDEALAKIAQARPDLVLLDIMMPGRNGFAICSEVRRADPRLPILFLTSLEGEADQVRGFGMGGDDYIVKSASDAEVLARVRRAIERTAAFETPPVEAVRPILRLGAVEVDFDRLTVRDGRETVSLTSTEAGLLRCLALRRGEVCTKDEIFAFLRGEGYVGDPAAIRVHLMNLRRKLGRAGDMVVTMPHVGYYLVK